MNRKAMGTLLLLVPALAACGGGSAAGPSGSGTTAAAGPSTASIKICILSEFRTRPDGLPGLAGTYNPAYSRATYTDIGTAAEESIGYGRGASGEVFTSDSAIDA